MKLELRADTRARLNQITQLCDELSVTLNSEPDVVHVFLASQAQAIRRTAEEWAESKTRLAIKGRGQ